MPDEGRSFAAFQALTSGAALLIAGPAVDVRNASDPLFFAAECFSAVAGLGLLAFALVRNRRRSS